MHADEPARQLAAESTQETSGPCRRCGSPTNERRVLRDGEQTLRASLWLCSQCRQPQHRAHDDAGAGEAAGR